MNQNTNYIVSEQDNSILLKSFNSITDFRKREFSEHHHSAIEISFVEYGSGVYRVSDVAYNFEPGDIFLFSNNEIHYITEVYDACSFITLQFEPRFLWGFNSAHTDTEQLLGMFFNRNSNFTNRIDRTNPATKIIGGLICKIYNEMCNKELQYENMSKSALIHLLVLIARNYDYIDRTSTNTSIASESLKTLDSAMNYINTHLDSDLNLEEIARNCHLNKSYFSTLFKKLNGMSPWEYITLKRIELSIHLLKNTKLSTLEISQKCGFNTPSNFYRAFKKLTAQNPNYYRKSDTSGQ